MYVEIRKPKICYFGKVISQKGLSLDPEKIKTIVELPAPKTVLELRQLLGMINYLGKILTKPVRCEKPNKRVAER